MTDVTGEPPSITGWPSPCITTCGGQTIIGGFKCYGAGASISKTYTITKAHYQVSVQWDGYWIDSWDGGENFILIADSITRYSQPKPGTNGQRCGDNPDWHDYVGPASTGAFLHTAGTITLTFTSGLNQGAADESFGFKNIVITVWPNCATGCSACYGNLITECTACSTGWYLSGNTCVTDCGLGYWNDGSTNVCSRNFYLICILFISFFSLSCILLRLQWTLQQ